MNGYAFVLIVGSLGAVALPTAFVVCAWVNRQFVGLGSAEEECKQ